MRQVAGVAEHTGRPNGFNMPGPVQAVLQGQHSHKGIDSYCNGICNVGKFWAGQVVNCRCDNDAVVAVLTSRSSKDPDLIYLLRCLTFSEARLSFRIVASHIAGKHNVLADALSRNNLPLFLQASAPEALSGECVPPQSLVDMLISKKPDWTFPSWSSSINKEDLQNRY